MVKGRCVGGGQILHATPVVGLDSTSVEQVESGIVPNVTAVCPQCGKISMIGELCGTLRLWQVLRPWLGD